jgi:hypothetical protein
VLGTNRSSGKRVIWGTAADVPAYQVIWGVNTHAANMTSTAIAGEN